MLLSSIKSLAAKCVSLNNEPCMARPTLIDLNPTELNYYPFTISLDKCVPSETKGVNVKVFDMIIEINEAKTLVKHLMWL